MKLSKKRIKKLIKESIISAMDPAAAKKEAVNLLSRLDKKMKSDPNMQPYYNKLHGLYKGILSYPGDSFANIIPNNDWETGEQAISLIESILMILPEDEEYKEILRNLNEMYDVFHRSEDGGYEELYRRKNLMSTVRHGHLMQDFLSGDIEKLALENPGIIEPIGEGANDFTVEYDKDQYKQLMHIANELNINLEYLAMIPNETLDSLDGDNYLNPLHSLIIKEINSNYSKQITEQPLKLGRLSSIATRYHVQTARGVFPFLVVSDSMSASYSNIYLPAYLEAIADSQYDSEEEY